MKKVPKSSATPPQLVSFQNHNPHATWDDLRAEGRAVFDEICKTLELDQGGICAYCERSATRDADSLQVEHIVAKSSQDPSCNWNLEWLNMLAVCRGGSQRARERDRFLEPLPANLSCDQHKNHLVNNRSLGGDSRGFIVNPLELPAFPPLVVVLHDGRLIPHPDACSKVEISPNAYSTTEELIARSIEHLNLNCARLCLARSVAAKNVAAELKRSNPEALCPKFLSLHRGRRRQFFTVYRCRLGKAAEMFLAESGFQG
ncbi:MAG: retron system putative HNH endonuclease [Cyanobium sp.]